MGTTYAQWQPSIGPTALRGPWGDRWSGALGTAKDEVLARAKDAVRAGFILDAPEDSLARHGADVVLEKYPSESVGGYRDRIHGAWETWRWAGTRHGISTALVGLLGPCGVYLANQHDWPAPDGLAALWSRFRVYLTGFQVWGEQTWGAFTWGWHGMMPWSLLPWGAFTWGSLVTWGSTATPDEVTSIRDLLRKWKNARDRVTSVNLSWDAFLWGGFAWGAGWWGIPGGWGGFHWGTFVWGAATPSPSLVTWTTGNAWSGFVWGRESGVGWGTSYFC